MLVQRSLIDNGFRIKFIVLFDLSQNDGKKSYDQCFVDYSNVGAKLKLSHVSQDIIVKASGQQGKSSSVLGREIAEKQKEYFTPWTINNYRLREGLELFHVISRSLKLETHISDRLWLCDWLKDWAEEDFLHLAPADEFFVSLVRRPNYQNDRIWAKSIDDIAEDERYREMVKNQTCIGICVMFTAKRLLWVMKDKGESWTGQYFRDIILTENVFSFLKNKKNVIDPDEVIFVHNKAPCMRANQTQHLFQDKLKMHVSDVLTNMETDTDLFETLICSYPSRLRAVKNANGLHTDY